MSGKINKLLLLALPLALAACGGGGGDNPAADNNKPQNQNNNSAQPDDGVTYTGVMFNAKGERAPTTGRSKFVLNDGKVQYQLPRSSQGATQQGNLLIYGSATGKGGHYTAPDGKSYESFQMSNNLYYYSQFGVAKPVDGEIGGFYRGVAVSNMPTSGSATYKTISTVPKRVPCKPTPISRAKNWRSAWHLLPTRATSMPISKAATSAARMAARTPLARSTARTQKNSAVLTTTTTPPQSLAPAAKTLRLTEPRPGGVFYGAIACATAARVSSGRRASGRVCRIRASASSISAQSP